jgi:hypothetical protein
MRTIAAKIAADAKLSELDCMTHPVSPDPGQALLELESRAIMLWGVGLERFLERYLDHFDRPAEGKVPLSEEERDDRFEVAFDERTQPLTRHLVWCALQGRGPLSLAQLAERRYSRNTASFRKMQRSLLRSVAYPMRDLHLWCVESNLRKVEGKNAIERYFISAGPALLAFYEYAYVPLRTQQLAAFHTAHPKGLVPCGL